MQRADRMLKGQRKNEDENAMRARGKAVRSISFAFLRLAIGVVLLVYLAESRIINFRMLAKITTALPITLAALALSFLDITFMALRLSWLFRPQGLRLPLINSLELTLVSSFFATFLPGAVGGDFAKLFYAAKENKGRRTEIATIVAFDRMIGFFSMLLLPCLFSPLFAHLIRTNGILRALLMISTAFAVCLLTMFLLCLFNPPWMNRVAQWVSQFLPGRKVPERVITTVGVYRNSPQILFGAFGASLASNLILIAATAMAVFLLSPGSLSLKICLVVPLGEVANSLPLTPGGLGVGETAFNALFKIVGLQGGAEALLCWRIWRALVGLIGLAFYLRGVGRVVFGSEAEPSW
jgi:glycosyltransferase 2 family protein